MDKYLIEPSQNDESFVNDSTSKDKDSIIEQGLFEIEDPLEPDDITLREQ